MPMTFGSSSEKAGSGANSVPNKRVGKARTAMPDKVDAFERLVSLCEVRDRSRAELFERLEKDGYDALATEQAISRATECGILDDIRFAQSYIRGHASSGKGSVAIEKGLEKHGIDPSTLEGWPDGFGLDERAQTERARALLESHPPKAKDAWGAAFRKLVSKGYPASVASRACRLWAESADR